MSAAGVIGGGYEGPDAAARQYHPYVRLGDHGGVAGRALGDTSVPYDLNATGAVLEIKRALRALAQRGADPLQNPTEPIVETVWKELEVTGPDADAWTGAASDELVTALSRHAPSSGIAGPYIQLGGSNLGKYGIVGGAQPTAAGLEVIAGAVEQHLGGAPAMSQYLKWRDGTFPPPSSVSAPPPTAVVAPSRKHGTAWNPHGYTPAWSGGDPELLAAVAQYDDALVSCLQQQLALTNETQRLLGVQDCLWSVRAARHQAVLALNAGAPEPECPPKHHYDAAAGRCAPDTGVVDLPPPTMQDCVDAYMSIEGKTRPEAEAICRGPGSSTGWAKVGGAVALGAALGLGLYYVTTRRVRA